MYTVYNSEQRSRPTRNTSCVSCVVYGVCVVCGVWCVVCHMSCVLCGVSWVICDITRTVNLRSNTVHKHAKHRVCVTGWRRLIGSPKLQIIFLKRATKYRSILLKITYKDKGSYESSPPCMWHMSCVVNGMSYVICDIARAINLRSNIVDHT